jgi:hypothetical protein
MAMSLDDRKLIGILVVLKHTSREDDNVMDIKLSKLSYVRMESDENLCLFGGLCIL